MASLARVYRRGASLPRVRPVAGPPGGGPAAGPPGGARRASSPVARCLRVGVMRADAEPGAAADTGGRDGYHVC